MKALPSLRLHTAKCALAAALLAWGVTTIPLQAQDEPGTPVESTEVEAPRTPTTHPEVESPARAGDSEREDEVRLQELVTIRGNVHLRANETTREMVTIMGNAIIDGVVNGDCVSVMGNVTINGRVRGDLVCVLGQVTLGPGAEVRGEVVAIGGGVILDPTARIRGEKIVITIPGIGGGFGGWLGEWFQDGLGKARILPHEHTWAWSAALFFVLLNLLFAGLFRGAVVASAHALETRPVLSAVNGALVFLFFPVLLILLVSSVVGIVLIPVAGAGLFLCWFIGTIGVYCFCGQQFGLRDQPVLAALAGNLVFLLLFAVPVIGMAVWSVTGLMGLGGAITALSNKRREAKEARAAVLREQQAMRQHMAPPPGVPPSYTPQVHVTPTHPVYMAPPAPIATPPPVISSGFVGSSPSMAETATPASGTTFVPPYSGWTPPIETPPTPAAVSAATANLPPLPVDDTLGRAAFWPRLGAFAIDFFAVTLAVNFLGISGILLFVLIGYHIAFWGWRSTTPGGIVFNLRIVRIDNRPMDYAVATVRALGGIFSLLPAGLGFIWASFDSESQAWHDKLAGTVVVSVRKSTPLV